MKPEAVAIGQAFSESLQAAMGARPCQCCGESYRVGHLNHVRGRSVCDMCVTCRKRRWWRRLWK